MIITKTPLRISFAGGGTDLPAYYQTSFGAVFSASVNLFIHVIIQKSFDGKLRLRTDKEYEEVDSVFELQHKITKACLEKVGILSGVEIISISDVPAGTGLGSSSCYTVGLLHALYAYKHSLSDPLDIDAFYISPYKLAEEACDIEINQLSAPIGKQDQYAAAFGGINYIQFNGNESVNITRYKYLEDIRKLNDNLMMFYIGGTRSANEILQEQNNNTLKNLVCLDRMRDQALELFNGLYKMPQILNVGWKLKKSLASGISNSKIDEIYDKAIAAGAQGGKVLGAGGAGFILLYCPVEQQPLVRNALRNFEIREIPIRVGFAQGSDLVYG